MRVLRLLLALVLVGVLLSAVAALYAINTFTDAPVDPAWEVAAAASVPPGAVTVRFTGTSTLLFSDGETRWMTDGWFSRPGLLKLLLGKIGPDVPAIQRGLAANGVDQLAAVMPLHSHYDHAMDAPEVARRTGALLLGSEATANIGRGWGLPESQIRVFEDRRPLRLGRFVVTPIESRHFQFPDPAVRRRVLENPDIDQPLVPPVPVFDYRLGKAYVLHVSHPRGSWLIVGSAGYVEGALQDLRADVVFLGVGGLGSQTPQYREAFWRETVEAVSPGRVIPIHHDSLTGPTEGPFTGPALAVSLLSGGSEALRAFLRRKQQADPALRFQTLPRYAEVVLFE